MLEQTYAFLSNLLGTKYEREGLIKAPVDYEIPLDAIREALVNAVAHRAYDYEVTIRITLYSDRIKFLNPGTFYASINPENLKEGLSRYRNPLIADPLRKKGIHGETGYRDHAHYNKLCRSGSQRASVRRTGAPCEIGHVQALCQCS